MLRMIRISNVMIIDAISQVAEYFEIFGKITQIIIDMI